VSKTIPEERIKALRAEINRHNRLYYVEAAPEISDREFDRLMDELIALEKAHPEFDSAESPSRKVGGAPIDGFVTVVHRLPMLSIDNTYQPSEVREFDTRLRKLIPGSPVAYSVEPKIDGVAISLTYENGVFTRGSPAATARRGMMSRPTCAPCGTCPCAYCVIILLRFWKFAARFTCAATTSRASMILAGPTSWNRSPIPATRRPGR